jgi:hypothetical protein
LVEFDGEPVGAEFIEHSASADGVQLVGVTDECEPPSVSVGVVDELVEIGGVEHSCFVDHDRRARRWRLEAGGLVAEVVEEFGDGVGSHPGLGVQDLGCFRGGCESEDVSASVFEVEGGGVEHGGLAGSGGSDDEDESVVASNGCCCFVLSCVE